MFNLDFYAAREKETFESIAVEFWDLRTRRYLEAGRGARTSAWEESALV